MSWRQQLQSAQAEFHRSLSMTYGSPTIGDSRISLLGHRGVPTTRFSGSTSDSNRPVTALLPSDFNIEDLELSSTDGTTFGAYQQPQTVTFDFTENIQEFAGVAIGFAGVFGELIFSHPFVSFRRQCQLQHDAKNFHVIPFFVLPVMRRIAVNQGLGALWKGLTSVFIIRGMGMVGDTIISELTPLPKEVSRHSTLKKILQHLLHKSLSAMLCAPFYAASLVESVQSNIASEPTALWSCLREGFRRCILLRPSVSRLLPLWKILPCIAVLEVLQYSIRGIVQLYTCQYFRGPDADVDLTLENSTEMEDVCEQYYSDLVVSSIGGLCADVLLFPLETVVHRLCAQGTRLIIDNVDNGLEVAPVITAYSGLQDAVNAIAWEEGSGGFYRGLGALLLQYAIHLAFIYATRVCYEHLLIMYSGQRDERRDSPRHQLLDAIGKSQRLSHLASPPNVPAHKSALRRTPHASGPIPRGYPEAWQASPGGPNSRTFVDKSQ